MSLKLAERVASRTHQYMCVGLLRYTSGKVAFTRIIFMKKDSALWWSLIARMSGWSWNLTQTSRTTDTEKVLIGNGTGKSFLNTMFLYNCMLFGPHGVDEHRGVEIDQIRLGVDQHGHFIQRTWWVQRHVEAKEIMHHFQNLSYTTCTKISRSSVATVVKAQHFTDDPQGLIIFQLLISTTSVK